jgi:tRNA 2-thiouridine synthesizing protein E
MVMNIPERDGDGYLLDMNDWTPAIGLMMAEVDRFDMDVDKWAQVLKARDYYLEHGTVPPIRKFAKYIGIDKKVLFKQWMTGPMKPISKYGGLPKPTGCV